MHAGQSERNAGKHHPHTHPETHTHTPSFRGPLFQLTQSLLFPLVGDQENMEEVNMGETGVSSRPASSCFRFPRRLCTYVSASEQFMVQKAKPLEISCISSNNYTRRQGPTVYCTSNIFQHWFITTQPHTMSEFVCHNQCKQVDIFS